MDDNKRYVAMGAGGYVGMNMVGDDGPMRIAGFVAGAWLGQQAYMLIDGPGSISDSLTHPVSAVEHTLVGDQSLGQTAVTGAAGYATYKAAPTLYKGGKAAYGMVAGESTAVETVEAVSVGGEILEGAEVVGLALLPIGL
jgi:hypothetical protein